MNSPSTRLTLTPSDNLRLARLCGPCDENLHEVEQRLHVSISQRGNLFDISGEEDNIPLAAQALEQLYKSTKRHELSTAQIQECIADLDNAAASAKRSKTNGKQHAPASHDPAGIRTKRGLIKPRNTNQQRYIDKINTHDISFGIGPAGTGKTYLAVACAIEALEKEQVARIILTRPAVESGERLGFLPGALEEKIEPYLRPLYDALYEMLGVERVAKLIQRSVIEIAPLAYMRGRTLNDAFILLDEAQNTTLEQMKMFLTRIGFGSRSVITGDATQVDLPHHQPSGLHHVMDVLQNIPGLSFTFFDAKDVVRHPLVQRVIEAYEAADQKAKQAAAKKPKKDA